MSRIIIIIIISRITVNRCCHIESGRPAEFDKTELLQAVQPVHASLSAEDGQRFCEKIMAEHDGRTD